MKIVIAGKGGVGKTLIAGLFVLRLSKFKKGNILAIDADPNSNLNMVLGVNYKGTVSDIAEELKRPPKEAGISRLDYLRMALQDIILEDEAFDLLVMGRPEKAGCYCAVNDLLRNTINELSRAYHFIIVDSEAGMEHISRKTSGDMDLLLIVAEPTMASIRTASEIYELARDLGLKLGKVIYLVNKVKQGLPPRIRRYIDENGMHPFYVLPYSEALEDVYEGGRSLRDFNDGRILDCIDIIIREEVLGLF